MLACDPQKLTERFGPYFVEPMVAGLDKDNKPFVAQVHLLSTYFSMLTCVD